MHTVILRHNNGTFENVIVVDVEGASDGDHAAELAKADRPGVVTVLAWFDGATRNVARHQVKAASISSEAASGSLPEQ